jgi:hypothetical protein
MKQGLVDEIKNPALRRVCQLCKVCLTQTFYLMFIPQLQKMITSNKKKNSKLQSIPSFLSPLRSPQSDILLSPASLKIIDL